MHTILILLRSPVFSTRRNGLEGARSQRGVNAAYNNISSEYCSKIDHDYAPFPERLTRYHLRVCLIY